MSQAGSRGVKGLYFALAIVVIAIIVVVIVMVRAIVTPNASQRSAVSASITAAPAIPMSSAPQEAPAAAPQQPVSVDLFDPTHLVVTTGSGGLIDTQLSAPTQPLNGVLNPSDQHLPNMLIDSGAVTRPGTAQGTVLIIAHSRQNDDANVFNKLMDLSTSVPTDGYRVVLSDDGGHSMSYVAEKVLDVRKTEFGQLKNLQDNRPGRVLLMTSWIEGTYPSDAPRMARVVIACDAVHPGCSEP